jgi:hypothetical protein
MNKAKIEMLRTGRNRNGGKLGSQIQFNPNFFDVTWHCYKCLSAPKLLKMQFYYLFKGSYRRTVPCNVHFWYHSLPRAFIRFRSNSISGFFANAHQTPAGLGIALHLGCNLGSSDPFPLPQPLPHGHSSFVDSFLPNFRPMAKQFSCPYRQLGRGAVSRLINLPSYRTPGQSVCRSVPYRPRSQLEYYQTVIDQAWARDLDRPDAVRTVPDRALVLINRKFTYIVRIYAKEYGRSTFA